MDSYSLPEFTRMTSGMDVIHVIAANSVSVFSEFDSGISAPPSKNVPIPTPAPRYWERY